MCLDICLEMCLEMCLDIRVDMCLDMCLDKCLDLCLEMCLDLCLKYVWTCVWTYVWICEQETILDKTYVDDQNLMTSELELGKRWDGKKLTWRKDWQEEDEAAGEASDVRTMREIRKLSNSIMEFIVMEEDVASNYPDKRLPILDLKVWTVEKCKDDGTKFIQLATEFFEKTMVSDVVMMERSAMPKKMKLASLSQEVVRRNRNQTGAAPDMLRAVHLTKFMFKLKTSGYSHGDRLQILLSGQRRYAKMVKTEVEGGRPVNRPGSMGERRRRLQRLVGKRDWFKKKKKKLEAKGNQKKYNTKARSDMTNKDREDELRDKEVEAVLFVPFTPGSKLCKIVQEIDDEFVLGTSLKRIKVVERVGPTLEGILCKASPWKFRGCSREECFPCQHGGGQVETVRGRE